MSELNGDALKRKYRYLLAHGDTFQAMEFGCVLFRWHGYPSTCLRSTHYKVVTVVTVARQAPFLHCEDA